MPSYRAPVEDYRYLLHDLFRVHERQDLAGFEMLDPETTGAVLEGGAKVCEDILQPLNQLGDEEGCTFENGQVKTPTGFKRAYEEFCAGGWNRLGAPESLGGASMPAVITFTMTEMMFSANQAFGMYPGLTNAAYAALSATGEKWMREHVVPKMASGEWCGTMCLTEPHCGTDLKLMKSKAVEQDDGTFRLTGTKIFISGGDHDLTDNIVHMVIAKIPNEDGSLADDLSTVNFFMVPKMLVDPETGKITGPNAVSCGSIEKKMGIKGSATCVMNFDGAVAYRLGGKPQPKQDEAKAEGDKPKSKSANMAGMFGMMNAARMGVGVQGVAIAEVAYQNAVTYARERLAGRALTGAQNTDGPADPIIVHTDIRKMLLSARAFVEGARAVCMWVSIMFSESRGAQDEETRQLAGDLADLLTPVVKAYFTDMGFEAANASMQVFGGHGYVRDHGMEQFVRDARINQVYEGANGVQAMDLVGRKLRKGGGRAVMSYIGLIDGWIKEHEGEESLKPYTAALRAGLDDLTALTLWLSEHGPKNPDNVGAGATEYLRIMGIVTVGFQWAKMAKLSQAALDQGTDNADFHKRKITLARFWMERHLPDTASLRARAEKGCDVVMELDAALF